MQISPAGGICRTDRFGGMPGPGWKVRQRFQGMRHTMRWNRPISPLFIDPIESDKSDFGLLQRIYCSRSSPDSGLPRNDQEPQSRSSVTWPVLCEILRIILLTAWTASRRKLVSSSSSFWVAGARWSREKQPIKSKDFETLYHLREVIHFVWSRV